MTVGSEGSPIAVVTSGEWGDDFPSLRFVDGESTGSIGAKVEAYMERIAYGAIPVEMAKANARLIAAAPEMLAALQAFVAAEKSFIENTPEERKLPADEWNDWLTDAYKQAVAVIEKATGQEAPQ